MQLELAGSRRRVDALVERHERDAERLQFFEQRDQVAQIAAEAIEAPDDEDIEPATSSVDEQAIKRRPAVLRPADAAVDVLLGRSPPRGNVAPDLRKLILRLLAPRTGGAAGRQDPRSRQFKWVPGLSGGSCVVGGPGRRGRRQAARIDHQAQRQSLGCFAR